tara:strand:- start:12216 stop:13154 length:939 start_codon:yes stop_codon:yes gene_type:complete
MGLETAAIIGIASLAMSAGTTIASGAASAKQRKIQAGAEADADRFMKDARDKLDVNEYDELSINKLVYDNQREELSKVGAALIENAQQSDRPNVGIQQIVDSVNKANTSITEKEVKELQDLDLVQAEEATRKGDIGIQLDLGEVAGAQKAAADAGELAQKYKSDFMTQLPQTAMAAVSTLAPVFGKNAQTKGIEGFEFGDKVGLEGIQAKLGDADFVKSLDGKGFGSISSADLGNISNLKGNDLEDYVRGNLSGANMKFLMDKTTGNANPFSPTTGNQYRKMFSDAGMNSGQKTQAEMIAELERQLAALKIS